MTKRQGVVLSFLERTWSPITAVDIYTSLKKENSDISLSTIYLALKLFVKQGWVHEIDNKGSHTSKQYVRNANAAM